MQILVTGKTTRTSFKLFLFVRCVISLMFPLISYWVENIKKVPQGTFYFLL